MIYKKPVKNIRYSMLAHYILYIYLFIIKFCNNAVRTCCTVGHKCHSIFPCLKDSSPLRAYQR